MCSTDNTRYLVITMMDTIIVFMSINVFDYSYWLLFLLSATAHVVSAAALQILLLRTAFKKALSFKLFTSVNKVTRRDCIDAL